MGARLSKADVTELLNRWQERRPGDEQRLLEAVESELHRIAVGYMRCERRAHTLQPTALVNEAYLRPQSQMGRPDSTSSRSRLALCDRCSWTTRVSTRPPNGLTRATACRGPVFQIHSVGRDLDVLALHKGA